MSAEAFWAITVDALRTMRDAGDSHAVLDVREPWEIEICRFSDSIDIPLGELPRRLDRLPADRPVVVVCHHGIRSMQATQWLRANGFANAINLTGGIDAYARQIDPLMAQY